MVEIYSGSSEPIQVRRADLGVAVGAEGVPSLLICIEYEDIRSLHGCYGILGDAVWMESNRRLARSESASFDAL